MNEEYEHVEEKEGSSYRVQGVGSRNTAAHPCVQA